MRQKEEGKREEGFAQEGFERISKRQYAAYKEEDIMVSICKKKEDKLFALTNFQPLKEILVSGLCQNDVMVFRVF